MRFNSQIRQPDSILTYNIYGSSDYPAPIKNHFIPALDPVLAHLWTTKQRWSDPNLCGSGPQEKDPDPYLIRVYSEKSQTKYCNNILQILASSCFLHGSIKRQNQQITKSQMPTYKRRKQWKNLTKYT